MDWQVGRTGVMRRLLIEKLSAVLGDNGQATFISSITLKDIRIGDMVSTNGDIILLYFV